MIEAQQSDELQPEAWTVDELARRVDLPVRTIREYQTIGLLPRPRRQGRIGLYGRAHLVRLQLIGRLQERGYSLAGIADLLSNWREGADLEQVLGLEPDQLVHIDEPGAPATLDQLIDLLPTLAPTHLAELVATGVVEACGPDRFCVPSPSLLQLSIDALDAGIDPAEVLGLLGTIRAAAEQVADEALRSLAQIPADATPDSVAALVRRGRGLLAHGVGRLTLHAIGSRLGITDDSDVDDIVGRLATHSGGVR